MTVGAIYWFLYCIVRTAFFLWHPIYRVIGRDNLPAEGKLVICSNHSGMADPLWVVMSMRCGYIPRIMAKKEATKYPIIGRIMKRLGVIGVDRDVADVHAIKEGLRALKNEQQLLIFPEGTRVRDRKDSQPKRGAVTLAARTDAPIMPVYVSKRSYPWQPVCVMFGKPYKPVYHSKRPTDDELEQATADLMNRIYAMGDTV